MNSYKSFYLEDLRNKIRAAALDTMLIPMLADSEDDKVEHNSDVALFNDGVLSLAIELINELEKEAGANEDNAMD